MIQKVHKTKVNDLDEKGRVVIAVNAFGNEDSDGDISVSGSFTKTLKENFARVKWFLNHNRNILLGVPLEGVEDAGYLKMVAQLNMEKQVSRDVYSDYKLYAEHGKTLEHSIGVDAIKRDEGNKKKVMEWKLWEFSTLTSWGANENTPLLEIKSYENVAEKIAFLEKALKVKEYSDERLKKIEETISALSTQLGKYDIVILVHTTSYISGLSLMGDYGFFSDTWVRVFKIECIIYNSRLLISPCGLTYNQTVFVFQFHSRSHHSLR